MSESNGSLVLNHDFGPSAFKGTSDAAISMHDFHVDLPLQVPRMVKSFT